MTDKITLISLQNQANDSTAVSNINANSVTIQSAFDNTLSRDGTAPNQMEAPLDMNSFPIINLPAPLSGSSPLRLQDLTSFAAGGAIHSIPAGGTTGQILSKISNTDYAVAWETSSASTPVTNAVLAAMPTLTIKSNISGGTDNPSDNTITAVLDALGSTQGSVLYRNSTAWVPLTPGTSGQVLTSGGGAANPAWGSAASGISLAFGGRLTPLSATPVTTTDVSSQNLYYAPLTGNTVPIFDGTSWGATVFTSGATDQVGLTLALAGSSNWATDSIHDVFAVNDSGTLKLGTRVWDAGMFWTETLITPATAIVTGSTPTTTWSSLSAAFDGTTSKGFASCATINPSNAGLTNCIGQDWGSGVTNVISKVVVYAPNDHSMATVSGVASATETFFVEGSNDNTNWHRMLVIRVDDTGTSGSVFTLPINLIEQQPCRYHRISIDGGAGGGAVRVAQVQFFKFVAPTAGRRLTLNKGIWVNDGIIGSGTSPNNPMRTSASTTITTALNQGTYLGTIHIDVGTAGQVTVHRLYGLSRTCGVWNAYNKRKARLQVGSYATAVSYRSTSQLWNLIESTISSTSFTLSIIQGLAEETINAELTRTTYQQTALGPVSYEAGIGVDTSLTFSGMEYVVNTDTSGLNGETTAIGFTGRATCTVPVRAGLRTLYGIERQGNNGTGVQDISTGVRNSNFIAEFNA